MTADTANFVEVWKNHKKPKTVITVDDYFKAITKESGMGKRLNFPRLYYKRRILRVKVKNVF